MAKKIDPLGEELIARLEPIGDVRYRLMFGAAGLYVDEVMTGCIDDGVFYLKVDDQTRPKFEAEGCAPFQPMADKPPMPYFEVPEDVMADDKALRRWTLEAREASLRSKKKPRRKKKPRS